MQKVTKAQVMELLKFCHKPENSLFWVCKGFHLISYIREQNEKYAKLKSESVHEVSQSPPV